MQRNNSSASRVMPPVSPARQENLRRIADNNTKARERSLPKRATPDYSGMPQGSSVAVPFNGRTVKQPRVQAEKRVKNITEPKEKVKKIRERMSKFDMPFFTIVIVLLAFGIVMMFSASYAFAHRVHGDSYYYVSRQLMFIAMGLAAMIGLSFIDYGILKNKGILTLGAGVTAALMLITPLLGLAVGGSARWLDFGTFTVQPSEILKFVIIIVFAYFGHTRYSRLNEFKYGFRPFLTFLILSCGLMLIQPHLSGAIIIFAIGIIMMLVAECKLKHILVMLLIFAILAGAGLALLSAVGGTYFDRVEHRIAGWLDPELDVRGTTFQTYQSLITIGSGGFFGLGLGNSRQKYAYLPESHNDFIFSIVCEELGFVGAALVILLFVLFIARGYYIAAKARDRFGMLLAVGITSHMGIQALLNIGVATNSIPNTGISLPFFSYGGSALMMQLAEIGVILNISRKSAIK